MAGLLCSLPVDAAEQKLLGAVHWDNADLFLVASGFQLQLRTASGDIKHRFDDVKLVDCDSDGHLLLITESDWILYYPDGTRKTRNISDPHPFLALLDGCRRMPLIKYPVALIPGRVPELMNLSGDVSIQLPDLYRFESGQYAFHDLSSTVTAGDWLFVQKGDGIQPIRIRSMKPEGKIIDTARDLNSAFLQDNRIALWTVGGEQIVIDAGSAATMQRKREKSDRNSAVFRLPMESEPDIPVRVDMQNSGFMGALDALNAGRIGLKLSIFGDTDREQSWDFSVSVRNPDTFFVSAVHESGALVFRFADKTVICYPVRDKVELVELDPEQSFAVCANQLFILRDNQIKRRDPAR